MARDSLDARDRPAHFVALEAAEFDLAIIGGGVTGAGVARDAALRGLKVALVEARDWASGTSSRSSKMIHGGLRYLAQGDIGLVKEAASERQVLRRIAPHLTRIEPFVIPVRDLMQVAKVRAGMWAFEKLGLVPDEEKHDLLGAEDLKAVSPALRTKVFGHAVRYYEFLTDDARLVVANVRDAQSAGAVVVSYAEATELIVEGGRTTGLVVRSTLPGEDLGARVKARLVINAAGPWVDAVRGLDTAEREPRLSLSRGIHLVFRRERLPTEATIILPAADKRSIFVVPRGRFAYVGTTDTFQDDLGYWPGPTRQDVDYLIAAVQAGLDVPPLKDDEIVALWSGVRPLVAQAGKSASEVSRKDEVWTSPSGLISIAGGKLSAYRAMAERIVDLAAERLGGRLAPCATAERALPGAEAEAAHADVAGGARHAVLHEGALRLEDWWVRRSLRAWFDDHAGLPTLAPAAEAMGELLGWDAARKAAEIAACRAIEKDSRAPLAAQKEVA
jgi:glycerol-3-phosphate dehydrogenase